MFQTAKVGGTTFHSPSRHPRGRGALLPGDIDRASQSSGIDIGSSVAISSLRPDSPPAIQSHGSGVRRGNQSPGTTAFDWRENNARLLSQMTNAKIDQALRGKIIHQYARRQFDQNTTSDEQLRSFKIVQQLQKQTTG